VDHMDEVLKIALERELIALPMTTGPAGVEVSAPLPVEDRAH